MKFKNIGKTISWIKEKIGLELPYKLAKFGNKSKRTGKSNLTKGAYGSKTLDDQIREIKQKEKNNG